MFFRRGVSDDDPWLKPKMWLFSAGAILALVGMGTERVWLIGIAGALLAAGVLIRFLPHSRPSAGRPRDDAPGGREPDLPEEEARR